jgi:geranylgeranyl pyrophosphate synthase
LVGGDFDAIIGAAPLPLVDAALDRLAPTGAPYLAFPLGLNGHGALSESAWESVFHFEQPTGQALPRTYLHLLRAATGMFQRVELERIAPRVCPKRAGSHQDSSEANADSLNPVTGTEDAAYEFLEDGGRCFRPFITLAVYDAVTGGQASHATNGASWLVNLPLHVKRIAASIEVFHKASLVHDDIEDDDPYRYGKPTLHKRYGIPTAINVGDFLIGLGYRLISRETSSLDPRSVADILDRLAHAHMRLAEGQGGEIIWRDGARKAIAPDDVLEIYALKTSPAFEAAFYSGVRLAGSAEPWDPFLVPFSRSLGIAFQIANDLGDWQPDAGNKLRAGGDVLGGRPTLLWAYALQELSPSGRKELLALSARAELDEEAIADVFELYRQAGAFEKALAAFHAERDRAQDLAASLQHEDLRWLMFALLDTILERPGLGNIC